MYTFIGQLHLYNRWILVAVILAVLILSFDGWLNKKPFGKLNNALSGALVGLSHLQLLLGIVVLFLRDWDMAYKINGKISAYEHVFVGIIGVALIQIGRTLSKKTNVDIEKHKKIAIFTAIAALLILSRQPNWHF
jgi:hypothetical protein